MVVGAGFEPAKLSRQIYSLIPLATREPHRMPRYCIQGSVKVNPDIILFNRHQTGINAAPKRERV